MPGFRVFIATRVVPFHVPDRSIDDEVRSLMPIIVSTVKGKQRTLQEIKAYRDHFSQKFLVELYFAIHHCASQLMLNSVQVEDIRVITANLVSLVV